MEKNFTVIYKNGKTINQNTLTSVKQLIEMDGLNINVVVNNLNNDILVDNTKIESTLVQCDMVEDIESIEFNSNYVTTDIGEFIVFDSYEDAETQAVESCISIIEDCGLTQNLIDESYIKGWINGWWFEDFWREHHEFLAYEEGIQYIATEEEMEAIEAGELDEEEVRENYLETLNSNIGNPIDEYKFQFGDEEFQRVLLRENLIDIDKLAEWCVDMDGVGHYLASYDGDEIECNGYYIYRTN